MDVFLYSSHAHFFHSVLRSTHGNRQPSTACLIPYGYDRASFGRGQQSLNLGKKTRAFYKLEFLPLCYNERGYTFRGGPSWQSSKIFRLNCDGITLERILKRRRKFMSTFVLVHGAWHGGWCYKRVAERLRAKGHVVYTPTNTGLGERSHLYHRDINLDTHITDILNVIKWEDLDDFVLVGHSYNSWSSQWNCIIVK